MVRSDIDNVFYMQVEDFEGKAEETLHQQSSDV